MSDNHATATLTRPPKHLDYSLTGENSTKAIERGLAEADWYQSPVPRAEMRKLLERRDGPAIRDTILWFALLGLTGWGTFALWGTALRGLRGALRHGVGLALARGRSWHGVPHGLAE
jgi:fatty acid desaturase